ncbi:MAG: hypothetical protein V4724_33040 [Pseudomonadota bacterium]
MKHSRTLVAGAALLLAFGLAACHSNDDNDTPAPPVTPVTPPVVSLDAFIEAVKGLIASSPDDAEPKAVDAIAATAPEDAEPVAL